MVTKPSILQCQPRKTLYIKGDSSKAKKPQANITSEPQLETIVANTFADTVVVVVTAENDVNDVNETNQENEAEPAQPGPNLNTPLCQEDHLLLNNTKDLIMEEQHQHPSPGNSIDLVEVPVLGIKNNLPTQVQEDLFTISKFWADMADETEEEISDPDETTVAVEKEPPFINVVSKSQKKKMKKNGKSPQGATSKKFQRGSLQNSFLMKIYDRFH